MKSRHELRLRKPKTPWSLVPPPGPTPEVPNVFPPPPAEEEEEDEEMANEAPFPRSGDGDFVAPSKKMVIKSPFMKRASQID